MEIDEASEWTLRCSRRILIIITNEIHVAIWNLFSKRIKVLVKYSFLAIYITHLSLKGLVLISIALKISTLFLHTHIIVAFGILNHIFWPRFIPLKNFIDRAFIFFSVNVFLTFIDVWTWFSIKLSSHLKLSPYVFLIIENWISFARLSEAPNAGFDFALVIESLVELSLTVSLVRNLVRVFKHSIIALPGALVHYRSQVLPFETFINSKVVPTVKWQINWRLHILFAFASVLVLFSVYTLAKLAIIAP